MSEPGPPAALPPASRRTVPRPLVAAYVLSVTAVAVFLAAVGDWLLAGALIGVELLVSGLIALAIRRPPAPPRRPGGPRLGTPLDPGNPSGRRPRSARA